MSGNNKSSSISTPLLDFEGGGGGGSDGEDRSGGRWRRRWERVLDLEEAKKQVLFGLPMVLTNVFYYSITLVSVMFAGHLGDLELAGATLANSWAFVMGFAFMVTPLISFLSTCL